MLTNVFTELFINPLCLAVVPTRRATPFLSPKGFSIQLLWLPSRLECITLNMRAPKDVCSAPYPPTDTRLHAQAQHCCFLLLQIAPQLQLQLHELSQPATHISLSVDKKKEFLTSGESAHPQRSAQLKGSCEGWGDCLLHDWCKTATQPLAGSQNSLTLPTCNCSSQPTEACQISMLLLPFASDHSDWDKS